MNQRKYSHKWIAFFLLFLVFFLIPVVPADKTTKSAFDSSIQASSSVSNMEKLSYTSSLRSTLIGSDGSVPGEVHYSFSITGLNSTTDPGAIGMARSEFLISSLEGRDLDRNISYERFWKDSTEVSGTIVNFRKNFDYTSGFRL